MICIEDDSLVALCNLYASQRWRMRETNKGNDERYPQVKAALK